MAIKLIKHGVVAPAEEKAAEAGQSYAPEAKPRVQPAVPTQHPVHEIRLEISRAASNQTGLKTDRAKQQNDPTSILSKLLKVLSDVLCGTPVAERQRLQELIQNLERIAEEQKKRHPGIDPEEALLMGSLVASLGPEAAHELMQRAKSLAVKSRAGSTPGADNSIVAVVSGAAQNAERATPFVLGDDIVLSVKDNPAGAATFFASQSGMQLFRERLLALPNGEEIFKTIGALRDAFGLERFSTLLAAYDSHFGRPLVADLVNRFDSAPKAQESLLSRLCGAGTTLFTASETARAADFIRAEQALVVETITLENQRARLSLVSLEVERARIIALLAEFLGDKDITSLPSAEQQQLIQRKIADQFPGMYEMSLPTIQRELEALAHNTDLGKFREHMKRLGCVCVAESLPTDREGKTQDEIDRLDAKKQQDIQAEMQSVKERALQIATQLDELSRTEERINTARTSAERGVAGELQAIEAHYGALLSGVFPEVSSAQNAALKLAARTNLETLDERIQRAIGPEREALCHERDSIEWASVKYRVAHHLTTKPPNTARALELLTEFQLKPGTGDIGRGADFLKAAQQLSGSIQAVDSYLTEQSAIGQQALVGRLVAKDAARAKLDTLEVERQKAKDKYEEYDFLYGSQHWNRIYRELGELLAIRESGVALSADQIKRINSYQSQIKNAGFFSLDGGSGYSDVAVHFHKLEAQCRLTDRQIEDATRQAEELKRILAQQLDEHRGVLLAAIAASATAASPVSASPVSEPHNSLGHALDQGVLEQRLIAQGALREHFDSARKTHDAMLTTLEHVAAVSRDNNLMPRDTTILFKPTLLAPTDQLPEGIQSATGAKDINQLALKLHTTLRHDRTLVPSPEALSALLECVGSDSAIGKQIIAARSAKEVDQVMSQLYARLAPDDAIRVRLFMLSYDTPEIYRFFGVADDAINAMTKPSGLWRFLSSLPSAEQSSDLSQLISIMPQLRTKHDIEQLVSKVSDQQLAAVLDRYQALSGQSLGAVMLELAPRAGEARYKFLVECIAPSRVMRQSDLAPLYPRSEVPTSTQARQEQMRELVSRDRRESIEVDTNLTALISAQAKERAALQAALPAMTQLQRTERVAVIRQRLADLDAKFSAQRDDSLQRYDPAVIARTGVRNNIEEARGIATHAAFSEVSDPHGPLGQQAALLVDLLSADNFGTDFGVDEVMDELRRANLSEGQMALLETFYLQQVSARTGSDLTGDLPRDILARQKQGSELNKSQLQRLITAGAALAEYDYEQLTEGIRTRNPRMTVRAMIAIKSREGGEEILRRMHRGAEGALGSWEVLKESREWREAQAYLDAVFNNDTVTQGIVELKQGFGTAALRTGEFFGKVCRVTGDFTDEQMGKARKIYQDIYDGDIVADLERTVPALKDAWSGLMSKLPAERAQAAVAAVRSSITSAGIDFSIVHSALDSALGLAPTLEQRRMILAELDEFARGLPNSWSYVDGRPMSIIEYLRSNGGPMGKADAAMLEHLLSAEAKEALSEQELLRYLGERRRVEFQIKQLDILEAQRLQTHRYAQDFFSTVANMHSAAEKDRDERIVLGMHSPTWSRANRLVQIHSDMRSNQLSLLNQQRAGLADIAATRELVRLRGEMLLSDIITGEDRGLRVEQSDRSVGALRTRDAQREWVAVRRDLLDRWRNDAEIAQKSLENLDWWVTVGYQSLKAIAIICVSIFASPAAGLALACAWNLAEKTHMFVFNGMSLDEAVRQFAIDFALDAAFAGLSCFKFARLIARGGAAAEGAVKPITRWRFFVESPFKSYFQTSVNYLKNIGDRVSKWLRGSKISARFGDETLTGFAKVPESAIGGGAVYLRDLPKILEKLATAKVSPKILKAIEQHAVATAKKGGEWIDLVIKEVPISRPVGKGWITNIDDILLQLRYGAGRLPSFKYVGSKLGEEFLNSGGLKYSRWVEIARGLTIDGSSLGHLGSGLFNAATQQPKADSDQAKPPVAEASLAGTQTTSSSSPAIESAISKESNSGSAKRSKPAEKPQKRPTNRPSGSPPPPANAPAANQSTASESKGGGAGGGSSGGPGLAPGGAGMGAGAGEINSLWARTLIEDRQRLIDLINQSKDLIEDSVSLNLDEIAALFAAEVEGATLQGRDLLEQQLLALADMYDELEEALKRASADLSVVNTGGGELKQELNESKANAEAQLKLLQGEIDRLIGVLAHNDGSESNSGGSSKSTDLAPLSALGIPEELLAAIQSGVVKTQGAFVAAQNDLHELTLYLTNLLNSEHTTPELSTQILISNLNKQLDLLSRPALRNLEELSQYFGHLNSDAIEAVQINRLVIEQLRFKVAIDEVRDLLNRLSAAQEAQARTLQETQLNAQRGYIQLMQRQLQERLNLLNQSLENLANQMHEAKLVVAMPAAQQLAKLNAQGVLAVDRATELLLSHARIVSPNLEAAEIVLRSDITALAINLPPSSKTAVLGVEQLVTNQIVAASDTLSVLATEIWVVNGSQPGMNQVDLHQQVKHQQVNTLLADVQRTESEVRQQLKQVAQELSTKQAQQETASNEALANLEQYRCAFAAIKEEAGNIAEGAKKESLNGAQQQIPSDAPPIASRKTPRIQFERRQVSKIASIEGDRSVEDLANKAEAAIKKMLSEVVQTIPATVLDSLKPELRKELEAYTAVVALELRGLIAKQPHRDPEDTKFKGANPSIDKQQQASPIKDLGASKSNQVPTDTRDQRVALQERLELGLQASERLCNKLAEILKHNSAQRQLTVAESAKALAALASYTARSSELIRQAAEGVLISSSSSSLNSLHGNSNTTSPRATDLTIQPVGSASSQERVKRRRSKRSARDAAREADERRFIIQQLLSQNFERIKREKLLHLLIKLGISQSEYRNLVAKLGELDAKSAVDNQVALEIPLDASQPAPKTPVKDTAQHKKQHSSARQEPNTRSIPMIKSDAPRAQPSIAATTKVQTRADLYLQLRKFKESRRPPTL